MRAECIAKCNATNHWSWIHRMQRNPAQCTAPKKKNCMVQVSNHNNSICCSIFWRSTLWVYFVHLWEKCNHTTANPNVSMVVSNLFGCAESNGHIARFVCHTMMYGFLQIDYIKRFTISGSQSKTPTKPPKQHTWWILYQLKNENMENKMYTNTYMISGHLHILTLHKYKHTKYVYVYVECEGTLYIIKINTY